MLSIYEKWAELEALGARFNTDGLACTIEIPPYWSEIGRGFSYDFAAEKAWDNLCNLHKDDVPSGWKYISQHSYEISIDQDKKITTIFIYRVGNGFGGITPINLFKTIGKTELEVIDKCRNAIVDYLNK